VKTVEHPTVTVLDIVCMFLFMEIKHRQLLQVNSCVDEIKQWKGDTKDCN